MEITLVICATVLLLGAIKSYFDRPRALVTASDAEVKLAAFKKAAFAEKRRVLERDREEWSRMFNPAMNSTVAAKKHATEELKKIDNQLLAVADEELKTLRK